MPKLPKLFIHLSSSDVQKGDIPPFAGEMSPFSFVFSTKQQLYTSSVFRNYFLRLFT